MSDVLGGISDHNLEYLWYCYCLMDMRMIEKLASNYLPRIKRGLDNTNVLGTSRKYITPILYSGQVTYKINFYRRHKKKRT